MKSKIREILMSYLEDLGDVDKCCYDIMYLLKSEGTDREEEVKDEK